MWFWLALGSAVLGAVDIILSKKALKRVSAALVSWSIFTLTIPLLLLVVLIRGIPNINTIFVLAVIGSSLAYVLSRTLINDNIKNYLISQMFPLTAFSGLFTYILGIIFLSETLRPIPVFGLFTTLLGAYILNADQAKEDLLKPFKLLFTSKNSIIFLFAILLGALTAILDKVSIVNTIPQDIIFVFLIDQLIMSFGLTIYLISRERNWLKDLKQNFGVLSLNSFVYLVVGLLVFSAYVVNGPVALVIGIKRLQIFFILLLSMFLFNDKPTRHSWIATIVMVIGVLMIRLG